MRKKLFALFLSFVMALTSLPMMVLASDADAAQSRTLNALESIGVVLDLNDDVARGFNEEFSDDAIVLIPELRKASSDSRVIISSEDDVAILLAGLEMLLGLTCDDIHIDGAILVALEEAGLREYWWDSVRNLLDASEMPTMQFSVQSLAPRFPHVNIPFSWIPSFQHMIFSGAAHWQAAIFEYVVNYRLSHQDPHQGNAFLAIGYLNPSFRQWVMPPMATNSWQLAHGGIVTRHYASTIVDFTLRNHGLTVLEVVGHVIVMW